MNKEILELMKKYNSLVERFHKANKWFEENPNLADTQIDNFRSLLHNINTTRQEITNSGYDISDLETWEGFKQIKFLYQE